MREQKPVRVKKVLDDPEFWRRLWRRISNDRDPKAEARALARVRVQR